jgi:hypothetical protein
LISPEGSRHGAYAHQPAGETQEDRARRQEDTGAQEGRRSQEGSGQEGVPSTRQDDCANTHTKEIRLVSLAAAQTRKT